MSWSHDGKTVAIAANGSIVVATLGTEKLAVRIKVQTANSLGHVLEGCFCISQDGHWLAAYDWLSQQIVVWDVVHVLQAARQVGP